MRQPKVQLRSASVPYDKSVLSVFDPEVYCTGSLFGSCELVVLESPAIYPGAHSVILLEIADLIFQ